MVLVARLVHHRLRVVAAQSVLAGSGPHQPLAVHLGDDPIDLQTGCLNAPYMGLDIAVQRIEISLTSGTPEEGVVGKTGGCGDTIGRARGTGRKVAKQIDIRIQKPGEFIVLPQRVELGQVGNIKALLLQAAIVQNRLQVIDDRVDIPMHLIERGLILPVTPVAAGHRGIEPRIDIDTAETHHAKWFPDHIHPTYWLPETDFQAELGGIAAEARGVSAWIGGVFLIQRCQRDTGDSQGEHAGPADIRDRVGKLSLAGCSVGRKTH